MPVRVYQPEDAYRLNVIGVPGEGKSVYRAQFLAPIFRATLWNPMDDFNIGEIISVDEYRRRIDRYRKDALQVTVHPTSYAKDNRRDEFDRLCGYVYEVGAQHFAQEEIALVAAPNSVPGNQEMLYIKGRHRAVSLSAFGQRFHQFPLIVRGTSTEIVAFRQTDPIDVKDFEDRIYPHESPVPLNQLPPHHFIDWTPENGAVLCEPLEYTERSERREVKFDKTNGETISFIANFLAE